MTAPYRDHLQAIRAALNVDARSLYKPASWQALAVAGYRESSLGSDLSKLEQFQQDCMTLSFLHHRMPAHLWAVIVVRHAIMPTNPPDRRDLDASLNYAAEFDRLKAAIMVVAGHLDYDDVPFARWAVANWSGRLDKRKSRWDRWADHRLALSTLKQHYGQRIKPSLSAMLKQADATAKRLLADAQMIEQIAA